MREAWITGSAVVTAAGLTLEDTWDSLIGGKTAIRRIERFATSRYRSSLGATIPQLTAPGESSLTRSLLDLLLGRVTRSPEDSILIMATTKGGIDNLEKLKKGQPADPSQILPSSLGDEAAARLGITGTPINVSAACASSTVAVALGAELIASGEAESVVICALDVITEFVFSGFSALQILSPSPARPFDRDRDGLTLGEGAALLTLMSPARARQEGLSCKTVVAGWAITNDAFHITAPDRTGNGLVRAISGAMNAAGVRPGEIAGISAHGTGTVHNDLMELTAFHTVFGDTAPPISSVKGAIGHTFGAAGGIEVALASKALEEKTLPPTIGFARPEKGAFRLVSPKERAFTGDYLLTVNSGFGGVNAAIVLKRTAKQ